MIRMRSLMTAFVAVWMLAASASGQSTVVKNFDQVLSQHRAAFSIQPPPGKTWVIESGSFVIDAPRPGMALLVFRLDDGSAVNCDRCDNMMNIDLGISAWIPLVRGFIVTPTGTVLRGQSESITLVYPQTLRLHVSRLTAAAGSIQSWTRFSVRETQTPM